MAYSGTIKFISENDERAIVEESLSGATTGAEGHKIVGADFSAKAVADVISYTYNSPGAFNDGRDITIS